MNWYHGLPITPDKAAKAAIMGGSAFVSFAHPDQLPIAIEHAHHIGLDNGAFPAWRSGVPIQDWTPYYEWVEEIHKIPRFSFAVIPDVIDGDEKANDDLIAQWPWAGKRASIGVPVWHLHESIARLVRLANEWPRIALGSSGDYSQIGTASWWNRMAEAMSAICNADGFPICKIHGLRMLDEKVLCRFPFESADSTNIGQNIGIDSKWKGTYQPKTKVGRAIVLRDRIEHTKSPICWHADHRSVQSGFAFHEEAA